MEQTEQPKPATPRNLNDNVEGNDPIISPPRLSRLYPRNLLNGRKPVILKWTICLCVILLLIYLMQRTYQTYHKNEVDGPNVLLWKDWKDYQCPCILGRVFESSLLIDAVIVNADQLDFSFTGLENLKLKPNFLLVFAAKDPLFLTQNLLTQSSPFDFNFTMSYRLDSDLRIYEFYFSALKSIEQPIENFELADRSLNLNMDESSSWPLLNRLRKHMDLYDITDRVEFNDSMDYKFMLIFEPHSCPDFVHPDIYKAMMNWMVPVVIGTGNISHLLPPNSYINGADFPTPKSLAVFLKKIGSNQHYYEQYFWWRSRYKLNQFGNSYCSICAELKKPRRTRHPIEFIKWWTQYKCHLNNSFP